MDTLSKVQFVQQLKDPEIASIKRNIHLFRKTIRPYDWVVTSHNDKKHKYFELMIIPRVLNLGNYQYYEYFDAVFRTLKQIFTDSDFRATSDMGDIIEVSIPYNRPKD